MNYRDKFNKFEIATEILANRYLLTAVLVNVNNLCYYLEGREKAIRELLPEDKRDKLHKQIQYKDTVEFDRFSISSRYFNALVNEFNAEVVSDSCIVLDNYIKQNLDKNLTQPQINKKLKDYCKLIATKDRASNYIAKAIMATKTVDYKLIDSEEVARQYIEGIPYYMRDLDEGVTYLKRRFNIC